MFEELFGVLAMRKDCKRLMSAAMLFVLCMTLGMTAFAAETTQSGDKNTENAEKKELTGDFCRGCGYCLPCPAGIPINNCARMSLMVRRAPSAAWLGETWQENMKKIENCLECGQCSSRCPYELDTPNLLKKNYEDYKNILAGKTNIS